MTALVTGSSGFIGRALCDHLHVQGRCWRTLQRPAQDLCRVESLQGVCDGVESIFHLAGNAHVNQADTAQVHAVNVTGTANLLQAAIQAGVPRFIYVSSILADPQYDQPRTAYGESKAQAEELLRQAHQRGEIQLAILRPVNVYGPGMKGNLMTLLRLIRRGVMPPLPDFPASLSLLGVSDLCRALLCAETWLLEQHPVQAGAFVPTDGQRYTIKVLEHAMREALGKTPLQVSPPRLPFYLAALMGELFSYLPGLQGVPGLRSYRALARGQWVDGEVYQHLPGYQASTTFSKELPHIISAMK